MKESIYIAIDAGKSSIKAKVLYKGEEHAITFRTKMQEVSRLGLDIQPNSYHVEYLGSEYLLGDMVSEERNDYSLSKTSRLHQLAIYTAITQLIRMVKAPSNVDIHLAVCTPITTYKDAVQKEEFKKLVERQGSAIHLMVNGLAYTLQLSEITLGFEGMGEIYAQPEDYSSKNTIIIDIGGLNATLCSYNGIQPQINTMIVSDLGMNVLKGKIGKLINERYGEIASADDLELVLHSGYFASKGEIFEDSRLMIEEMKLEHLQQIIQFAKSRGYTFNMYDIVFVGGGSITLERYIKQLFPNSRIVDNPQFANCKSLMHILEIKYG